MKVAKCHKPNNVLTWEDWIDVTPGKNEGYNSLGYLCRLIIVHGQAGSAAMLKGKDMNIVIL